MTRRIILALTLGFVLASIGAVKTTTAQQQVPQEICVASWAWTDPSEADDGGWDSPWPNNTVGSRIDLRTLEQHDTAGEIAGYGIFVLDQTLLCNGPGMLLALPVDMDRRLADLEKIALEIGLDLPGGTVTSNTTSEALFDLMTRFASERGVKTILPNKDRLLTVHLGPWIVKTEQVDNFSKHAFILSGIQERYRDIYDKTLNDELPSKHYLRFLTLQMERYRTADWQQFVPEDLPKEAPLPKASVIGDTFVETSDTSLASHTATGGDGGHSWTKMTEAGGGTIEVVGSTDLISAANTSPGVYRAESSLDGGDHSCEMDINIGSGGTRRRWALHTNALETGAGASAEDYYRFSVNDDAGTFRIREVLNGSATTLATDTDTISGTQNLKGEYDGGTLTLYIDDVSEITASDSTWGSQLETGIHHRKDSSADATGDNYECTDLGAPPAARRIIFITEWRGFPLNPPSEAVREKVAA